MIRRVMVSALALSIGGVLIANWAVAQDQKTSKEAEIKKEKEAQKAFSRDAQMRRGGAKGGRAEKTDPPVGTVPGDLMEAVLSSGSLKVNDQKKAALLKIYSSAQAKIDGIKKERDGKFKAALTTTEWEKYLDLTVARKIFSKKKRPTGADEAPSRMKADPSKKSVEQIEKEYQDRAKKEGK